MDEQQLSPETHRERIAALARDLLAYGDQEATNALRAKDREHYQFWQGWCEALKKIRLSSSSLSVEPPASVVLTTGRLVLTVGGVFLAMEGDPCRDPRWSVKYWDAASLRDAAAAINAGHSPALSGDPATRQTEKEPPR